MSEKTTQKVERICDIEGCGRDSKGIAIDGKDYCCAHAEEFVFEKEIVVIKKTLMNVTVHDAGDEPMKAFYKAMIQFTKEYGAGWKIVKTKNDGRGWIYITLESVYLKPKIPKKVRYLIPREDPEKRMF